MIRTFSASLGPQAHCFPDLLQRNFQQLWNASFFFASAKRLRRFRFLFGADDHLEGMTPPPFKKSRLTIFRAHDMDRDLVSLPGVVINLVAPKPYHAGDLVIHQVEKKKQVTFVFHLRGPGAWKKGATEKPRKSIETNITSKATG